MQRVRTGGLRLALPLRPDAAVERFRIMQAIRCGAVMLVLACAALAPAVLEPNPDVVFPLTLGFTALALVGGIAVVLRPSRAVAATRQLLVLDAVWLTVGSQLSGAAHSPLREALLLHLAMVTVLVGSRTGLALAAFDTALLVVLWAGVRISWFPDTDPTDTANPGQRLSVFLVVLWIVAISMATMTSLQRRELRRRRHDLDALSLLTERVERASQPSAVAQTLLDAVVSSYGLRRGAVLSAHDGRWGLLASYGATDPGTQGASEVVEHAQDEGSTVLLRGLDPQTDAWLCEVMPEAGSLYVVPLHADGRPLGALVLETGARARPEWGLISGFERAAAYGGLALRNALLMESMQRLAATDGLTKIANRRSFETALERELARATRTAEHVSLVLLDLDHFKALNDRLGHQAGDEVLRNSAAALAMACRELDTPARYGGEEFAVILPGCGPELAMEIAERLREAIHGAPSPLPMTASAGVATYPAHAGDAESLVRAADEALYASKRNGRDRSTLSDGVPPEAQVEALIRRAMRERMRGRLAAATDGSTEGSTGEDHQDSSSASADT